MKIYPYQTIDKLIDVPAPLYRKIGLEKLIKKSEKYLGEIDYHTRNEVAAGYSLSTLLLAEGIITLNPLFFIGSGTIYLLAGIHHKAMSKKLREKKYQK